ncbi:MAG TPA: hypothetical protein VFP72_15885 [Kineosporiaceae bacterium]|nr:hypothetical protein [Kineosporiaceae bacterium]
MSPAALRAGSSQPATVNWAASQVNEGGQQPTLDLGGEVEEHPALAPLVQVGVAAVGDHDVGQHVGGGDEIVPDPVCRYGGEAQLQHPDRLSPAADRCTRPYPMRIPEHQRLLGAQHLSLGGSVDRHHLGRVHLVRPAGLVLPVGADQHQPHQVITAVVGDQEADRVGVPERGELVCEHAHRIQW